MLVILSILFTGQAFGRTPNETFQAKDTTDVLTRQDSLQPLQAVMIPADPKQGFKDLFVTNTSGSGVSTAELNPLAIEFVEDYMEKNSKSMDELKDWGRPYFDMMDEVLEKNNIPREMKYLAVIESRLQNNARSWAGAVGPWQFMPGTARNMGLRVSGKVDERRDLYKSTNAASKYLKSLFSMYGDWLLVIAAYNGGPGKVNSAIRRSGSRDFWVLQNYLPLESRNHVKKFIATHYMLEGSGGITTLTKGEAEQYRALDNVNPNSATARSVMNTQTLAISGRYNSRVISKHLEMETNLFDKINPRFDSQIASNGKYDLNLPAEKMEIFKVKKFDILAESVYLLLNANADASASTR